MSPKGLRGKLFLLLIVGVFSIQFVVYAWENSLPIVCVNGPYAGPVDSDIVFSSEGTIDTDGAIMEHLWSFGDGETSLEPNPSHAYLEEGVYTITLTVKDNVGAIGTAETYCMAYEIPNRNPIVCINGPYEGNVSNCIQFDCEGTYDPDDDNIEYLWDFGDGSQSHLKNTIHSYANTGIYTVTLTATDARGLSSTCTTECTVSKPPNIQPSTVINGVYNSTPGKTVNFSSYSIDIDGEIVKYQWDFGDGTTINQQNPTHTYSTEGEYHIQLTVTDNEGSTCTANTTCSVISANISQPTGGNNTIILLGLTSVMGVIIYLLRPQLKQIIRK